jgi:hypothetical protein
MPRRRRTPDLNVAVCADSEQDQAVLKAYVNERGWKDSGYVYRFSAAFSP